MGYDGRLTNGEVGIDQRTSQVAVPPMIYKIAFPSAIITSASWYNEGMLKWQQTKTAPINACAGLVARESEQASCRRGVGVVAARAVAGS